MPLLGAKKKVRSVRGRGTTPRTGLFARRQTKKSHPSVLFAAIAAGLVLVAAIALQETLPRRASVAEQQAPVNFSSLLPAGAQLANAAPVRVPGLPQPSYVVGYLLNDTPFAAFLLWDRSESAYVVSATVPLAAGDARLQGQPSFSVVAVGPAAPTVVLARGSEGASTDGIFILMQKTGSLIIATKVDENGVAGPAHFLEGASATHQDAFSLQDVNDDGNRDVVATATVLAEDGAEEKIVSVYAWNEGRFAYDADLSATLTLSARVFPEPTAAPKEEPSTP